MVLEKLRECSLTGAGLMLDYVWPLFRWAPTREALPSPFPPAPHRCSYNLFLVLVLFLVLILVLIQRLKEVQSHARKEKIYDLLKASVETERERAY
ncbi:uncharacterized [Tachysurus ichikawai]